jgi:hypothetical protein
MHTGLSAVCAQSPPLRRTRRADLSQGLWRSRWTRRRDRAAPDGSFEEMAAARTRTGGDGRRLQAAGGKPHARAPAKEWLPLHQRLPIPAEHIKRTARKGRDLIFDRGPSSRA